MKEFFETIAIYWGVSLFLAIFIILFVSVIGEVMRDIVKAKQK